MKYDAGYKHWDGEHLGIWARRLVIAQNGIKMCLQLKWARYLLVVCWVIGFLAVLLMFLLSQLLVPDSWISSQVDIMAAQPQAIIRTLVSWLDQHPEVSVQATHNLLFTFLGSRLLTISLLVTGLAIPHLITRDLSSRAIVIYSAKAIGRFDYLLSKFAVMFVVLAAAWLGPMTAAWFFGNLLSTKWSFFIHSFPVFLHILGYGLVLMIVVSLLAMGVSAISSQAKYSVSLWFALWLLGNPLVPISKATDQGWLKYLSFRYNLDQLGLAIFQPENNYNRIVENIPFLGQGRGRRPSPFVDMFQEPQWSGALVALTLFAALCVWIVLRNTKPK